MPESNACKILVAEDDKFLARAYEFKLGKMGYRVILAADGEEAMTKLREDKPDLLLLDLIMPKKNGFEVLAEVKADSKLKDIPVIIMSNLGQEADVKKGIQAGALDYVIKANTSLEDVVKRIEKVLLCKDKKSAKQFQKPQMPAPIAFSAPPACAGCGNILSGKEKFCPNCGKKAA